MVKTLYYEPKGTLHYNVKFKSGGMLNRLVADEVCGLKPLEIDWVYMVEAKRMATTEEVKKLCKPTRDSHP
jgi:hypothetical protein